MRVIAGLYKGRLLRMPQGRELEVRPTKDRVREAMFEILKADIADTDVLDLFSGSGALGIEALSRGAKSVTFVERDPRCAKVIEDNIDSLEINTGVNVIKSDVFKALNYFNEGNIKYGIIVADPPYGTDHIRKLLIKLDAYDILKKPFLIIVEHSKLDKVPQQENKIILLKQYKYGDIFLSVYIKKQ